MKNTLIIMTILLPYFLISVTREVSLDGTHAYTSIQTAINACNNGDIVQVHPGEYFEHLNTNGRSITIQSLYTITQSETTINNTIIHAAVPNSCLKINTQESVTINGFTMTNGALDNLGANICGLDLAAGGISVHNNSSILVSNCIITNCIGQGSGGVYFSGINFFMSNTKIFDNYGVEAAGGIKIEGNVANSIVFDSEYPNSIYNNTARAGMDIAIWYWYTPIHINLTTFSIILTEPDNFFFSPGDFEGITLTVQHAYFNLLNHDLYISPNGNNSNDGLTSETPLQTIAYAMKIIEPDSLNPKTIHLAPGTYNFSDANQYFPFSIKSHTRLLGDNVNNTIFDSEQTLRRYFGSSRQNDIQIENITFTPFRSDIGPIGFGGCNNITLRNLKFDGTFGAPRIDLYLNTNMVFDNIEFSNASINDENIAMRIHSCDNIILNNILVDDLDITDWMSNTSGLSIFESDVTLRNSIISNCNGYDVSVIFYQNIEAAQRDYTFKMSNTVIFNNISIGSLSWSNAPVSINNRYQRMKMNNCTFANNNGFNNRILFVKGDCDIANSIFYNPGNYREVLFNNLYEAYDENENLISYTHHPTVSYSLSRRPIAASDTTLVTTDNLIIGLDPLFLGSLTDTLSWTLPEYYKLSAGSPCINAGTPDTLGLNMNPMDLAGNYRVWNNRIDMGCFEYGSEHYVANDNPEYPTLPDRISLSTYPNPVYLNSAKGAFCFIEFTLPEKAKERPVIEIYNLKGQKVRTIKDNYELRMKNDELACNTGTLACKRKLTSTRHVLTDKIETDKSVYSTTTGKGACVTDMDKRGAYPTSYSTVFDCRDEHSQRLASGIYIVKVTSGIHHKAMKMTILK